MPQLRDLPFGARAGLSAMVLVLLGGLLASLAHLHGHYENRDERPGLTLDDLEGAYRGLDRPAPLLTAIQGGHPEGLDPEASRILVEWLEGDRIAGGYDDLDLGDFAPAELIAVHCLACHSRQSEGPESVGERLPLDYFDDVKALAFSQRVEPTPAEVLTASTHAHALSLTTLSMVLALLALATAWPRWLVSAGIAAMGLGLLGDIGGWWLAREATAAVGLVAVAGAVYNGSTALVSLGVLVDLWRPRRARPGPTDPDEPTDTERSPS